MPIVPYDRYHAVNPIIDCYKSGDGKWFWLLLLQADRHWGDLCRAIGARGPDGGRAVQEHRSRRINAPALVEELDNVFATKPLAEWAEAFAANNVWWAPVNWPHEVVKDPMVQAAGAFVDVPGPDGTGAAVGVDAGGLLRARRGRRGGYRRSWGSTRKRCCWSWGTSGRGSSR